MDPAASVSVDPAASVSMDPAASDSIGNSDFVLVDKDDKNAHAPTNLPSSVSDYVDGKICLICDVEFQSPILAINHAKTNHLDIIDIDLSTVINLHSPLSHYRISIVFSQRVKYLQHMIKEGIITQISIDFLTPDLLKPVVKVSIQPILLNLFYSFTQSQNIALTHFFDA